MGDLACRNPPAEAGGNQDNVDAEAPKDAPGR